jgi:hypothetical protein
VLTTVSSSTIVYGGEQENLPAYFTKVRVINHEIQQQKVNLWMKEFDTGAAKGCDQAFASGAATGTNDIWLHLPWKSFELAWRAEVLLQVCECRVQSVVIDRHDTEAFDLVQQLHPAPENLGGSRPLMARNVRILKPDSKPCSFVLAGRSEYGEANQRGGTEFGIKLAQHLGVPVIDVPRTGTSPREAWQALKAKITNRCEPPEC